ncbi:MAG: redoxin family protein [Gammaproteobacteria bacterium]|nr:redoxin family protein [Gammaproteobacteria bacterium]
MMTRGLFRYFLIMPLVLLAMVSAAGAQPQAGDLAPQDIGINSDGDQVSASEFKGKVLIVTFWASWCGYCLKELPVLEALQKAAGSDRLQIVAVNIEKRREFLRFARQLSSLTLLLTHDAAGQSSHLYGRKGIPHLVIVDRNGIIKRVHVGYGEKTLDNILNEVNEALNAS